eukprot:10989405-Ditylum_brightwellii.AAC.1
MAVSFHELSLLAASVPCHSKTMHLHLLPPWPQVLSVMAVLCASHYQEAHRFALLHLCCFEDNTSAFFARHFCSMPFQNHAPSPVVSLALGN